MDAPMYYIVYVYLVQYLYVKYSLYIFVILRILELWTVSSEYFKNDVKRNSFILEISVEIGGILPTISYDAKRAKEGCYWTLWAL